MCRVGPAAAQGTLGVSSTSLWTLCQSFEGHKLRSPKCYGCDMLSAYLACQTRGPSPGASAAARIVKNKRALGSDGLGRLLPVAILLPNFAFVACRPLESARPCAHIRAAERCMADRGCMRACVCRLAGAGAGAAESCDNPAPPSLTAVVRIVYPREQRLDLTLTCDTVLRKPLAWLSVVLSVAVHGNSDKDRAEAALEIAHADHTPRVQ